MRYALLIYSIEPSADDAPDPGEMQKWGEYTAGLAKRNAMLGGEALQPTATATTLRLQNGNLVTTDGPFAETKEALGGFYLLEAKDLDEAIDLARGIPNLPRGGAVELRPIMELPPEYAQAAGQ